MRVKNYSDATLTPTDDVQDHGHRGQRVRAGPARRGERTRSSTTRSCCTAPQVLPTPDTAAASGPIQGSLILFRLTTDSLQNRPLELADRAGEGNEAAEIDLDL